MKRLVRALKYKTIRLLRIRKGSHQVALGTVFGFFPCWFPTFGVGPALSVLLCKLVRGNVPAAILAASFGSFLWPVLFFLNYQAGRLLYSKETPVVIAPPSQPYYEWPDIYYEEPIKQVNQWESVGVEFLVGSIFNSIVFSAIGYLIVRVIMNRYRKPLLQLFKRRKRAASAA